MLLELLANKFVRLGIGFLIAFLLGLYSGYKFESNRFDEYKLKIEVQQQTQKIQNDYLENHAQALEKGTQLDTQGQLDALSRHYKSIIDGLRKSTGGSSSVSNSTGHATDIPTTCSNPKSTAEYQELEERAAKTTVLYENLKKWYNNIKGIYNGGNT